MTIETYMQYLGAFAATFLVLFLVAMCLSFFICLVCDKLPLPLPPQPDIGSMATICSISQLQQKDEEIEKLQKELHEVKRELHETKQYAGKAFSDVLYSGQASDKNEVIKIALAGLEKMRP